MNQSKTKISRNIKDKMQSQIFIFISIILEVKLVKAFGIKSEVFKQIDK